MEAPDGEVALGLGAKSISIGQEDSKETAYDWC
jgi:hypothetical protein